MPFVNTSFEQFLAVTDTVRADNFYSEAINFSTPPVEEADNALYRNVSFSSPLVAAQTVSANNFNPTISEVFPYIAQQTGVLKIKKDGVIRNLSVKIKKDGVIKDITPETIGTNPDIVIGDEGVEGDLQFLKQTYEQCGGASTWEFTNGWNPLATSFDNTWFGVTTGDSGRLVRLDFMIRDGLPPGNSSGAPDSDWRGNGLINMLPDAIGACKKLEYLNVKTNHLDGQLPYTITGCESMKYLHLSGRKNDAMLDSNYEHEGKLNEETNMFKGEVPPDIFLKMPNLIAIEFARTKNPYNTGAVQGTFPEIYPHNTALTYISLRYNDFEGSLPESVGNAVNARNFHCSGNNRLGGLLPASIGNFGSRLRDLQLSSTVGGGSPFRGPIPLEWAGLSDVRVFILHGTQYGSTTSSLNGITGPFPDFLFRGGRNRLLSTLRLEASAFVTSTGNVFGGLTGTLPQWTYAENDDGSPFLVDGQPVLFHEYYRYIKVFQIGRNNLEGPLPEWTAAIGNYNNIQYGVDINNFTGPSPQTYNQMNQPRFIQVQRNQLSGSLPPGPWTQSPLNFLRFQSNQFTGHIPASWAQVNDTLLSEMNVADNLLTSAAPELGTVRAGVSISLQLNKLTPRDLVPILNQRSVNYIPQKPFSEPDTLNLSVGATLDINLNSFDYIGNVYVWKKGVDIVGGQTTSQLVINNAQVSDSGVYTLEITHPVTGSEVFVSEPITVTVN